MRVEAEDARNRIINKQPNNSLLGQLIIWTWILRYISMDLFSFNESIGTEMQTWSPFPNLSRNENSVVLRNGFSEIIIR